MRHGIGNLLAWAQYKAENESDSLKFKVNGTYMFLELNVEQMTDLRDRFLVEHDLTGASESTIFWAVYGVLREWEMRWLYPSDSQREIDRREHWELATALQKYGTYLTDGLHLPSDRLIATKPTVPRKDRPKYGTRWSRFWASFEAAWEMLCFVGVAILVIWLALTSTNGAP